MSDSSSEINSAEGSIYEATLEEIENLAKNTIEDLTGIFSEIEVNDFLHTKGNDAGSIMQEQGDQVSGEGENEEVKIDKVDQKNISEGRIPIGDEPGDKIMSDPVQEVDPCCGDVEPSKGRSEKKRKRKTRFAQEVDVVYYRKDQGSSITEALKVQEPLANESDQQARSYRRRFKSPVN